MASQQVAFVQHTWEREDCLGARAQTRVAARAAALARAEAEAVAAAHRALNPPEATSLQVRALAAVLAGARAVRKNRAGGVSDTCLLFFWLKRAVFAQRAVSTAPQ